MKIPKPSSAIRYLKTMLDSHSRSSMKDGILRLRMTDDCNARCRFCDHWSKAASARLPDMSSEFLYKTCAPLYAQIKLLLLSGGEPLVHPEALNLVKFIGEKYPHITILQETNGIGFDARWREAASEHLILVHCSANAAHGETFQKGCWEGPGGGIVFGKILDNLTAYRELLKSKGLEAFGPSMSMVINKDNAGDVRDFVTLALKLGARSCGFYFERGETHIESPYFGCPDTSRPALKEMIKIERVLAGRFLLTFRLWLPLKELPPLQDEVDAIPLEKLQEEYRDLLELAQGRSMDGEHEQRQLLWRRKGKKPLSLDETYAPTLRQMKVAGKTVCFAPFKELDIYSDGRVECCGWIWPFRLKLADFAGSGGVDWDGLFNGYVLRSTRRRMLHGDYGNCMLCCPLNPTHKPVASVLQHNYERVQAGHR